MRGREQRHLEMHVGGRCTLSCAACDCHTKASDPAWMREMLHGGATRAVFRGDAGSSPVLGAMLEAARAGRVEECVVRTNALAYADPARAAALARSGAHTALVPLFSHVPAVHDRIAGKPEALVGALAGMRALSAAGLRVELEVPLLPARLQDPAALVALAKRAVPALGTVHFFLPRLAQPAALAPPAWTDGEALLARGLEACRAEGLPVELRPTDAIPLCALRGRPELLGLFRFAPGGAEDRPLGTELLAPCSGCAARERCSGVAKSYVVAHGAAGLRPWDRLPSSLRRARTGTQRVWTDAEREASRRSQMLVLRPTVHCNQDCTFCSANETTTNVWEEPGRMLRQIARAARRGVRWLSFSGGEPTLSPELASFVRAARRVGIPRVELVTNAVLLDTERRTKPLLEAGVTHAFVSLHAHDEALSRQMTQKAGDFERTLAGIGRLVEGGVQVTVNHVVNVRNQRFLTRFVELVHARFGGRTPISFAFVTPQYKALEQMEQVPRLSETMPHLRRALRRARALGQPFIVGSRQGVPPCLLGEFRAWSDVFVRANEAGAEDASQKSRGSGCGECRYRQVCTGLWKPYVARHGFDELRPIPGDPFTDEESARFGVVGGAAFDDLPEALRDRAAESESLLETEPERVTLPVFTAQRSRPVRALLVGTGRQAQRIARAAREVPGLSIDAVASPHAPEADLRAFGGCPAFRDTAEALDAMRPEVVLVAAETRVHAEVAERALDARTPLFVEKPLARTVEEAEALAARVRVSGLPVVSGLTTLFAEGLASFVTPARTLTYLHRIPRGAAETQRAWSRRGLAELLHHLLAVTGRGAGVVVDGEATWRGVSAPERLSLRLVYAARTVEATLEFGAGTEDQLVVSDEAGRAWRRQGELVALPGEELRPARGSDLERLLGHLRDVVLGTASPLATADEAVEVLRSVRRVLELLDAAGVPFDRDGAAPKHAASKDFRVTSP